jgi:two-component system NtrC family sensor kinase
MRYSFLFRRLNLNLRTEIIINISLLMLATILLIGFTTSRINEKNVIREKTKTGESIIQDFQSVLDFISRDSKDSSIDQSPLKEEIQEFIRFFRKEKALFELVITDAKLKVIASKQEESVGRNYPNEFLKKSIEMGQLITDIEKSNNLFLPNYHRLTIYSPLWVQGRIAGGMQIEIPIGDVMGSLSESQRMIAISIILDAIVLIVFGSFLLSHVLVKPLQDLVRLTRKVSEGDFSEKIEVTSKNEIGQLIVSFNRMTERLKENQENIENYLESLESANKKLKQTQEELLRTEKLASIGRFAAGVAHEVGNPLGSILGYTTILEMEGVERDEAKDYLKRIEKEIERINRIVRELLDFARPSKYEIQKLGVNAIIENAVSLLSYQKNFKNIQTRLHLLAHLPMIMGDESQLSQVFINIILNAVDAMPNGGMLEIQTEEYFVEKRFPDRLPQLYSPRRKEDPIESHYFHLRKPDFMSTLFTKFSIGDRLIKTRISDTGIGIKKEDLEKIFDPFYTTKDPDKGTGLGLSVSLRIIESMGGEIKVESEIGKGATFEIYFPAA